MFYLRDAEDDLEKFGAETEEKSEDLHFTSFTVWAVRCEMLGVRCEVWDVCSNVLCCIQWLDSNYTVTSLQFLMPRFSQLQKLEGLYVSNIENNSSRLPKKQKYSWKFPPEMIWRLGS